ncbi:MULTISPECIES: hypothetical protein [Rosenbergiella]|uniref:hypothetical protein n=1 Tax=Rosenbergiella TaxID=1356488 RepID=UPI001F4FB6AA|nr:MULTISPECIES: hypothetical protein [Rosenbergiella]
MKLRILTLLSLTTLSGCVSHLNTTDQPAGVYVDGLIAKSAETISHTQSDLNQTGPWPNRPQSPSLKHHESAVTTPTRIEKADTPVLGHVLFNGRSGPINFPTTSATLRSVTVNRAVQRIAPPGWKISWSSGTQRKRLQRVTVSLNDQWPRILDSLMARKSLYATIDWSASSIIITAYRPHYAHL